MLVNSFNVHKHPFHRRLFETRGHGAIIRDGSPTLADPHKDVFGIKTQLYRGGQFEMCVLLSKHASHRVTLLQVLRLQRWRGQAHCRRPPQH
jgi:hypothetical protein